MAVGRKRLQESLTLSNKQKEDRKDYISGILGFLINGQYLVEVPNRIGYVYVRLRDNLSEIIQASNQSVSPVYGLPVLISRDTIDTTRYVVVGRETSRYANWQTVSPYLPRHGNQHSFAPEFGGGGDIVWVYSEQIMPLLVTPSGSAGGGSVIINQDIVYRNNQWQVLGGTGTPSLLVAKPTDGNARMMLIGLGNEGNPWIVTGGLFAGTITGSAAITPYLPSPATGTVLAAVRLVSGTARIVWDNIYDLRNFF